MPIHITPTLKAVPNNRAASTTAHLPALLTVLLVRLNRVAKIWWLQTMNLRKLPIMLGNWILTNLKDISGYNFMRTIVGNSLRK